MSDADDTRSLVDAPQVPAPDGSTVRPLCAIAGAGSFAHFQLEPGQVSKAISHATVQEIWYIIAGEGEMWRRHGDRMWTVPLRPDVCLTIPLGTIFQFRADPGAQPLQVVAVTMPPWPTESRSEARIEEGAWPPSG